MATEPENRWKSLGTLIHDDSKESRDVVELIETSGFEVKSIADEEAQDLPCLINATGEHVGYDSIKTAIKEHIKRRDRSGS